MAWADFNGSNAIQTRRLPTDAIDKFFARVDTNGDAAWYLTDHLGSVREIVDDAGATIDEITYDPFGNITIETAASYGDRFKFTGREWDPELGLYYYRARMYDPVTGRFTGEDSIGFAAGDANLYRYVSNVPTNRTDPTGHWVWPWDPNADWGNWAIGEALSDIFESAAGKVITVCVASSVMPAITGLAMTANPLGAAVGGMMGCVSGVLAYGATNDRFASIAIGNFGAVILQGAAIGLVGGPVSYRVLQTPGKTYFKNVDPRGGRHVL
jgi:RHS repeat-associated protein